MTYPPGELERVSDDVGIKKEQGSEVVRAEWEEGNMIQRVGHIVPESPLKT